MALSFVRYLLFNQFIFGFLPTMNPITWEFAKQDGTKVCEYLFGSSSINIFLGYVGITAQSLAYYYSFEGSHADSFSENLGIKIALHSLLAPLFLGTMFN
jgi:hypothetical protein